jgi:Tol biopolymer transport system component
VQPFFSPDSQYVLFVDKPAPDAPAGVYGVALADPQAQPILVNETIGFRSPDRTIVATIEGNLVRFMDETNGRSWTMDTAGNWPRYSPDGNQILWTASDREGPYDRRQSDIWLADLDGGNPGLLVSTTGGGFAGWLPDSQHILLIDRDNPDEEERTLKIYNLTNDRATSLVREKRLRGLEISPNGSWIAYFLSFAEEPEMNGLWVVSSNGLTRQQVNVPGFGAYRWRDDSTLLYIPMRNSSTESMQLWTVDIATNQSTPLTDPAALSFSISNGDWEVSPDGRHLVFVNSIDQNIWLITLP